MALLPVLAILIGAVGFLGAATLTEFAVALFVGMAAGTYSSIFIATPVLVDLKKNEPEMKALERRVEQRRGGAGRKATDADGTAAASSSATGASGAKPRTGGPRQQPKSKKRSGGKR